MGQQRNKRCHSYRYDLKHAFHERTALNVMLLVVCLVHALTPKLGIWISNVFGAFKLLVLVVIVLTGFAALGGRLKVPKPHNFSTFHGPGTACELPPYAKSTAAANFAVALLQVEY